MNTRDEILGKLILGGVLALLICKILVCCKSPGLVESTLTGVSSQQGYPLGTSQPCVDAERAVSVADATAAALLAMDLPLDKERARDGLRRMSVCYVPLPEPCRFGGWKVGPRNPRNPKQFARKAGCSSIYHAWASKRWPPVCDLSWPDEPHCVDDVSSTYDIADRTLMHEVIKSIVARQRRYGPMERPPIDIDEDEIWLSISRGMD